MNIIQMNLEDKRRFRAYSAEEAAIQITGGSGWSRQELIDFFVDKNNFMEEIMLRYGVTAEDDYQFDIFLCTVEVGPHA